MKVINLPLWNFFERQFNKEYPSLQFENSDYWYYVTCFSLLLIAFTLLIISVYQTIQTRKKEREIHKPMYDLIADDNWALFFSNHFTDCSFEIKNKIINEYSITKKDSGTLPNRVTGRRTERCKSAK